MTGAKSSFESIQLHYCNLRHDECNAFLEHAGLEIIFYVTFME